MSFQTFPPATRNNYWVCTVVILFLIAITSCKKQATEPLSQEENPASAFKNNNNGNGNAYGTISAEMVLRWNKAAIEVVTRTQAAIPDAPITPITESRFYAMVNIAMHDALNNIVPKYKTYALLNARDKDADYFMSDEEAKEYVIVDQMMANNR